VPAAHLSTEPDPILMKTTRTKLVSAAVAGLLLGATTLTSCSSETKPSGNTPAARPGRGRRRQARLQGHERLQGPRRLQGR
jgi:hypothetical protein